MTAGADPKALYMQSQAAYHRGDIGAALSLAEQVLNLTQYSVNACGWAAWLKSETGQWQDTVDLAELGLHKGRSGTLLTALGRGREGLGDLIKAEDAYREAIQLEPQRDVWKFYLSRLLLRCDREFEAMELLQEAIAASPNPGSLFLLAGLELSFEDPETALKHARQALELGEADSADHTILARIYTVLGRDEEAETHWQAAEKRAGSREGVKLVKARLLRELGRFEAAASVLVPLEDSPAGLSLLSETNRATDADIAKVDRMLSMSNRKDLELPDKMALNFAIGKSFDDLGRYEEAIRHFDRANELAFEPGRFDRERYAAELEARKEAPHIIDGADPTEAPIFVVGMIRSGTTLLEQILTRHPKVRGAGEQKFWLGIEPRLREGRLTEAAATYKRLISRFLRDAEKVVDKQPGNMLLAGLLHSGFPNARILYMDRNPLDTAISIWTTNIRTAAPFVHHKGNIAFALKEHEALMRYWQAVIPSDRFMVFSYESLVNEQETTTRTVLDFCGLEWDSACLSPHEGGTRVITPSLWQVRQPVYQTSIARWKNYEPWLGEFAELKDK